MRVFIGGLPWATTDDDLRELFSKYGEITEARVIVDRETGRSRGFGFINFPNSEDGRRAIQQADGLQIAGRTVSVREAEDRKKESPSRHPGRPERAERPTPTRPSARIPTPEPDIVRRRGLFGEVSATAVSSGSGDDGGRNAPKKRKSATPPPERMFVERSESE